MSLMWRVFVTNAAVLAAATVALLLSPATVSFPVAVTEAIVLVAGLSALLFLNLMLLRPVFRPLEQLARFMRTVDPLRPGGRVSVEGADPEVAELAEAFNEMIGRLEDERRDSARRALAAQEDERLRIARELHDEVGQALTAIILELEQAGRSDSSSSRAEIDAARESVRETLEDVREIAKRLRPEALDDLGLPAALAALTNTVSRRTGVKITRRVDPDLPAVPAEVQLVVYRVAQEALTNVVRHSGADHAELELRTRDRGAELVVRDGGTGFRNGPEHEGSGIRGMRERAVLVGARLEVKSAPRGGTEVHLLVGVDENGA
jgi:two-component system sensor histidine kinase UhpB